MPPNKHSPFDDVYIHDEEHDRMYEPYEYHEGICPACGQWHSLSHAGLISYHMAYDHIFNRVRSCVGTGDEPYKTRSRTLYRLRLQLRFE